MIIKNKIRQLFRESIIIAGGKIVGGLGLFIIIYLLTNYLSPEEYGILNLVMTFTIVINQLLLSPLGAGSIRFFSSSIEYNNLENYIMTVERLLKKINYIVCLLGLILIIVIYNFTTEVDETLIVAVILFTVISSHYSMHNGFFLASRKQFIVSLSEGFEPLFKAALVLVCFVLFGNTALIVLIGYALGTMIVIIIQRVILRSLINHHRNDSKSNINWEKKILDYSLPLSLWGIFTAAHIISDRWSLQFFSTLEDVGLYSVIYQIGYFPVILAISIVLQVATPYMYQKAGLGTDNIRITEVRQIGKYLIIVPLVLTFIITTLIYYLSGFIFEYIISKEYLSGSYLLPYMAIAAGLYSTADSISLILQSEAKTNMLLKPKIVTAIMGMILNMLGAYLWGIEGVVLAFNIYGIVYLLWIIKIVYIRKENGFNH